LDWNVLILSRHISWAGVDRSTRVCRQAVMRWTRATCWDLTVFVGLADRDSSKWFRLNGMLDSYAQMYMYVIHAKSNLHA
jgi:hypothetical protein